MDYDSMGWKPLLRQVFISSGCWTIHFVMGIVTGAPTVVIPQLRAANITVSDEMASWLSSLFIFTNIPWIIILVTFASIIGRKKTSIFVSFGAIIHFTSFYFCSTPGQMLMSEPIASIVGAGIMTITVINISEYTSTKYRGVFLCLKATSFLWGIWVSNTIGTFFSWKYIPIFGFCVSLYTLTFYFWPESPYWLASKKRFDECRMAHRWLHGDSEQSELHLKMLIESQIKSRNDNFRIWMHLKCISRREFSMPLSLSSLSAFSYYVSGKLVIAVYAIDMFKKIISTESTVYSVMLILDSCTVLSAYGGCVLIRFYKRRAILFISSSIAAMSLITLSLYIYLIKLSIFPENVYFSVCLLFTYTVSISCGPMILSTSLSGELVPIRYKSVSYMFIAFAQIFVYGTLSKAAPAMMNAFGLHGTFLFYALSFGVCVCLLYLYLPETKDKSLLEIEMYFRGVTHSEEVNRLVP